MQQHRTSVDEGGQGAGSGAVHQYVEIHADDGRYAVELSQVRQLLRWKGAVTIPGATPAVRGAVNVRGQIVPVIDLRRALELPDVEYGVRGVVLLVQQGPRVVGILVESVSQVLELEPSEHCSPPPGVIGEHEPVAALLQVQEDTVFLIDVPKLAQNWLPTAAAGLEA